MYIVKRMGGCSIKVTQSSLDFNTILYIRHIFCEGFIFANFASRVLLANSTTRENKFTSDPDARMLFVYTCTQY